MKRKKKVRWGALTGALTTIAGIVGTVIAHPDVIASAAAKFGVSAALVGAIVQAVTKSVVRREYER